MTMRGSRCVVLGGGGFIGTNLRLALQREGAEVVGYGRPPRFDVSAGAWIVGEFDDVEGMGRAIDGATHVFHLLGSADPRKANDRPSDVVIDDLAASVRLLETCQRKAVGKIVFMSSGGTVYRPGLPLPIAEDAPTDPISAYGIVKLATEKYCSLMQHLTGLQSSILRIANPFGPYQAADRRQGVIAILIARALRGEPIEIWGDGSVVRDFVYVDDVVDAIITAAVTPHATIPINVGSGQGRTLRSVIDDVQTLLGREVEVVYKPSEAADVPANVLDIRRAAEVIGWRPRTEWSRGLQATIDWLRSQVSA